MYDLIGLMLSAYNAGWYTLDLNSYRSWAQAQHTLLDKG